MPALEQPTEVLEQFAAGDSKAFEALFRQFQGEVYGWIVRMVRDAGGIVLGLGFVVERRKI